MFTEKEGLYYTASAIDSIFICYNKGINLPDILKHLEKIKNEHGICYLNSYVDNNSKIYVNYDIFLDRISKFKKIIADFAGINSQQNDKDPTDQVVYLAVEALVKAYGLKSPEELLEKVKELTRNSSNGGQPDVNQAFINVNDLITANTVLNSQVESLRAQISALGIKPIV
jgi:hypothetical protein